MHPAEKGSLDDASLLLPFPGTAHASIDQVGGKGESLIRMAAWGLNVPRGVVVTTAFFAPWVKAVTTSVPWQQMQEASSFEQPRANLAVKDLALALPLDARQTLAMQQLRSWLANAPEHALFAVRSSSAQEDLQGSSFAGTYETRLGVGAADLDVAIRACFASAFDARVTAYKSARGLTRDPPSMAVIVQEQVLSDVAGVAFSLNPMTNDFDEIVIDASWGQGETVVGGLVSPDHWVLDKLTGKIIEQSIRDKQRSRWVRSEGGTIDRDDHRRLEPCLTEDQLEGLRERVAHVEALFGHPVDIEWALAEGKLHLLQARPVTAFVPVPVGLQTPPGESRRLYMDVALSSGLTMNTPISSLGLDVFRRLAADLGHFAFGVRAPLPSGNDALLVLEGARMYLDLSNALWLGGARVLAKKLEMSDAMIARTLLHIDAAAYRSPRRPSWARLRHLWRVPIAWWRLRRMIANSLLPLVAPRFMHARTSAHLAAYERTLAQEVVTTLPVDAYWDRCITSRLPSLLNVSLAAVGPGVIAVKAFTALARPIVRQDPALRDRLDRGFDGNVVVAMSVAMMRLAKRLPPGAADDLPSLASLVTRGELSAEFMNEWRDFLARFGGRGPMEMDVAHPRYADAPAIALDQIVAMSRAGADSDLDAASRRQIQARRDAAATVIRRAGSVRRFLLRRLDAVIECYAGLRDTPKHHLLSMLQQLRRRLLIEGQQLREQGRLEAAEDVFELTLEEIHRSARDPTFTVMSLQAERSHAKARLAAQVVNFPSLIDSRGRIPKPPPVPRRAGEYIGVGLSPGVVSGPARTLRSPHDRQLAPGDVLIAYTTDPGWTPLFCNAAAIVLEIGGALQHGAVVARELGLPCVAGIDGISTAIADGQRLEVDGHTGTVRLIEPPHSILRRDAREA